jgi:quercetin dioxygenase-like cupin family protein
MESVEKKINLLDSAEFSAAGPVKKDLIKIACSNIVLVCLEAPQIIPPHREPYAVVFVVVEGEGTITVGRTEHHVKPHYLVPVKNDENRGIRCTRRMVLLGIREDV